MRRNIRFVSLSLAVLMLASFLGACSPKRAAGKAVDAETKARLENLNTSGEFPIVKQPITLKFMVSRDPSQSSYKDILIWSEYEKKTNIHIDWDEVPATSIGEKRNLVLASGQNLPDAFFRCSFNGRDTAKYGAQGVFVKLNDYIDKYMPNFKKVASQYEDVKKGLPTVDGTIYALPCVSDCIEQEINPKIFLNTDFIKNVNGTMPKTTDELYTLLKKFYDEDANKNGKKDEIPITASSLTNLTHAFKGAFGLMNRGSVHVNVDVDPKSGNLRFIPTAPEFRQMLEYLHKLYNEHLLDSEVVTMTSSKIISKDAVNALGGMIYTSTSVLDSERVKKYEGIPEALQGPNGDKTWAACRSHISNLGAFTMTNTNKNPEATMRWMDYWYGDEGSRMFFLGVEGVSYQKNSDGKYDFIPEAIQIPKGSNLNQVIAKYVPYAGGANPALLKSDYFRGSEMAQASAQAAHNMISYLPKDIWGWFSYTEEESDQLSSLEADLFKGHYDIAVPAFITGQTPINDETWNQYVAKFNEIGLQKYMDIYKAGYDRYKKAK
ncbi:MAG: extracellular solute-binding protein [Bacillota bacterium]|nr:extracellular solute-binding protein [Bacillota bacterium]